MTRRLMHRSILHACLTTILVAITFTSLSILVDVDGPRGRPDINLKENTVNLNTIYVEFETSNVHVEQTINVQPNGDDLLIELEEDFYSPQCSAFRTRVCSQGEIVRTTAGTFDKCGREDNAIVYLRGGETACARHRHPHDHLLAGDLLAHYLGRLLGLRTPCLCVRRVLPLGQWHFAKETVGRHGRSVDWEKGGDVVVLAQWEKNLQRINQLPDGLGSALSTPNGRWTGASIKTRARWSDMIFFDYITRHYDRLAAMQDDFDTRKPPNQTIEGRIRNVAQDLGGHLHYFDNEAAFFDGYLLSFDGIRRAESRFTRFHKRSLGAITTARRSLVDRVRQLCSLDNALGLLVDVVEREEPLTKQLRMREMKGYKYLEMHFNRMLCDVVEHVDENNVQLVNIT